MVNIKHVSILIDFYILCNLRKIALSKPTIIIVFTTRAACRRSGSIPFQLESIPAFASRSAVFMAKQKPISLEFFWDRKGIYFQCISKSLLVHLYWLSLHDCSEFGGNQFFSFVALLSTAIMYRQKFKKKFVLLRPPKRVFLLNSQLGFIRITTLSLGYPISTNIMSTVVSKFQYKK